MEPMVYFYQEGRETGVCPWRELRLREEAVLRMSQELFGHRRPCRRQRQMIRTRLLLMLEKALAQQKENAIPPLWQRAVQMPACDRVKIRSERKRGGTSGDL